VKDNAACRPTVEEIFTFFDDVQMMPEEERNFLTPEFAQPRIPHDIIFAIGGYRDGNFTDCVEAYDIRADRWITVSSTQMYWHCALLNNACKRENFRIYACIWKLICLLY
jgi:kelch-like protein 10